MTKKSTGSKTIEISTETYEKLSSFQKDMKPIMKRKISFDKLIKVLFALNPVDELIKIYLGDD